MTDLLNTLNAPAKPASEPAGILCRMADGSYYVEEPGGYMRPVGYDPVADLAYSYHD